MTKEQKEKLVTAVITFVTTALSILFLQACTLGLSIAKNNTGDTNQEQTQSTSVDSTKVKTNLNK